MQILRAKDYKTMPWKNGMGSTTEIAIFPASAKLDEFIWRVSMAQVKTDGPFSSFAGIDRTLLILEGEGLDLTVADQDAVRIDRNTQHFFPGDQPTSAVLIDGPIVDLNVMSCHRTVTQDVRRIKLSQNQDFIISTQTILFVERGDVEVVGTMPPVLLGVHDALMLDAETSEISLRAGEATQVILIQFR